MLTRSLGRRSAWRGICSVPPEVPRAVRGAILEEGMRPSARGPEERHSFPLEDRSVKMRKKISAVDTRHPVRRGLLEDVDAAAQQVRARRAGAQVAELAVVHVGLVAVRTGAGAGGSAAAGPPLGAGQLTCLRPLCSKQRASASVMTSNRRNQFWGRKCKFKCFT